MTTAIPAGHIITWKVPSSVPVASLTAAMAAAHIPAELAGDLQPRHALSRAMRDLVKNQPRIARRLPKDDFGRPRMQITLEHLNGERLEYSREAIVTLMDDGRVVVSDAANTADCAALGTEVDRLLGEHLAKRLTNDLTRLVQRVVDQAGADLVPVREQGGAYFVPQGHDVVERLRILIEGIGGRLNTFAVTLGHGSEESIADTLAEYLLGQIKELKDSVADIGPGSRADVRNRRIQRAGELRQRLDSYRSLLAASADRVTTELERVDAQLMAAVAEAVGATMRLEGI
jgi:hypothetical protein